MYMTSNMGREKSLDLSVLNISINLGYSISFHLSLSVISKVTPDLEPTPPPPRTPVSRSGPGARMRSPPALPPPVPPPVVPAPLPPPVLVPPPPPPVFQAPASQAKARGCSVVTETVSAYVVRLIVIIII